MAEARGTPGQQSLQLILARNLLSTLSTPAFLVDPEGTVVFYNDAAGEFLGMRYEETGKMTMAEWREVIRPVDSGGRSVPGERLPIDVALREGRPDHTTNRIKPQDAAEQTIDMLALPLISSGEQHEGAVGVFWPHIDGRA